MEGNFSDKDKSNLVKLLNHMAEATYCVNGKEIVEIFSLMAWAQKELIQKIDSHILEITKVVEPVKKKKVTK